MVAKVSVDRLPVSSHMGLKATQSLYYSSEQADLIGLPFTHHVTINFGSTAIDPRFAVSVFSRLRTHHFNKWARRPGKGRGPSVAPTYAYVFENVRDDVPFLTMEPGDPHNVHVHWMVHVPPERAFDFGNEVWAWLEATAGEVTDRAAIDIGPVFDRVGLRIYSLKGSKEAERYGSEFEPQGIIIGKRSDTSRNIGPSARRARDKASGRRRYFPSKRRHAAAPRPPGAG